ncbi:Calcineurin-like phosphoesterase [Roseovarius sp. THAF9]|uniref:metallophosphoesterase family protein n=1 Tax=Roseovarius sp. THAF9 TaxID=2587847 RepID=UPI0012680371|nr:metallophosphoesterase [Roseovarius sp. THAF9]QFT93936.1 Calcineurin-like phosphoesterase [Roseovarius sp. THAF9]
MIRLVQISDLHFGREDPDLLDPLRTAIQGAAPDLVIMAGDFVQRARASQFRPAADFMNSLGQPWLGVPGNHDIPLYNLLLRALDPFRRYKCWICPELEPCVDLGDVKVVGLNTTDPWAHQRGRVGENDVHRVGEAISSNQGGLTIIAAHHPFHHTADVEKDLMIGASEALEHWAQCGPHVIMSGHLHQWLVEPFVRRKGANMTLQLHCGTGLSTRRRGHPNDFAVLDCTAEDVTVTRMVAEDGTFHDSGRTRYTLGEHGWERRGAQIER